MRSTVESNKEMSSLSHLAWGWWQAAKLYRLRTALGQPHKYVITTQTMRDLPNFRSLRIKIGLLEALLFVAAE